MQFSAPAGENKDSSRSDLSSTRLCAVAQGEDQGTISWCLAAVRSERRKQNCFGLHLAKKADVQCANVRDDLIQSHEPELQLHSRGADHQFVLAERKLLMILRRAKTTFPAHTFPNRMSFCVHAPIIDSLEECFVGGSS